MMDNNFLVNSDIYLFDASFIEKKAFCYHLRVAVKFVFPRLKYDS